MTVHTEVFTIIPSKDEDVLDFVTYLVRRGKDFELEAKWISSAAQQVIVRIQIDTDVELEEVIEEAKRFREELNNG